MIVSILVASAGTLNQATLPTLAQSSIRQVEGRRRSVLRKDPVEFGFVANGSSGLDADWKPIQPSKDGTFQGLPNCYLRLQVQSPASAVYMVNLQFASMAYINGTPIAGDGYGYGNFRMPVKLKKGANELVVACSRGQFAVNWSVPSGEIVIDNADVTLPDRFDGVTQGEWGSVVVHNASSKSRRISIGASSDEGQIDSQRWLPPYGTAKMPFRIDPKVEEFTVNARAEDGAKAQLSLKLGSKVGKDAYKRTFRSRVDGSIQYYGVRPSERNEGLVLSLHGASVEAIGQAAAYGPKQWGPIVCPTNRRPFGFDWEDMGRLDAEEVLADAKAVFQPDPARIYLTGHSMGGHGTWQLAAHLTEMFAAASPSAGWQSFETYAGGAGYRDNQPMEAMLKRANNPSDTLLLKHNFSQIPLYVLHGDADETVPVSEARNMRAALADIQPPLFHEEPGAGHWWDTNQQEPGADCVDWAPMFDLFSRTRRPNSNEIRVLDFSTVDPGIQSTCHWLRIVRQKQPLMLSRIQARFDVIRGVLVAETQNVYEMTIDCSQFAPEKVTSIMLDGQEFQAADRKSVSFVKADAEWNMLEEEAPTPKAEHGLKHIFNNGWILVVPTKGSADENRWALERANFDAQNLWYRGNATPIVVLDRDVDQALVPGSNLLLYGNPKVNQAWGRFVDDEVTVRDKEVKVGQHSVQGASLSYLFTRPGLGTASQVACIGGTDLRGMKMTDRFPYFLSGASLPDVLVANPEFLTKGVDGIEFTGFFGPDWRAEDGDWAKR